MKTKVTEIELLTSNIIRTRPMYQWDTGQILKVTDATIPDGTAVQFGNKTMRCVLEVYMQNNQVTIPSAALQQRRDLKAYIVVADETSETTVYEIEIPVIPKPKPEDYVADDQGESIKMLINSKANASGWTPNMYIGTDADGNMVTKVAPSGGGETTVPTKLSDLESDATHRTVTDEEKAAWNAKSNFSGSYNDLSDKPTIPTVPTNVSAFNNDAGYLTEHQDISGLASKPSIIITTLAAANWNSTTKTYSFEEEYSSDSYDIEVDIDGDDCTDEQLEAWIAAKPLSSSANKIIAKGDVPTVDIPIILTVTPK